MELDYFSPTVKFMKNTCTHVEAGTACIGQDNQLMFTAGSQRS